MKEFNIPFLAFSFVLKREQQQQQLIILAFPFFTRSSFVQQDGAAAAQQKHEKEGPQYFLHTRQAPKRKGLLYPSCFPLGKSIFHLSPLTHSLTHVHITMACSSWLCVVGWRLLMLKEKEKELFLSFHA